MEAEIVHVEDLSDSVIDEDHQIMELLDGAMESPELVLLFPTTQEAGEDGFGDKVEILNSELDCPLVGVSVGGFATHETDGLNTRGVAAVLLRDLDFKLHRFEDVWHADREEGRDAMEEPGTTLCLVSGGWGPSDTTMKFWSHISDYSSKVLGMNMLGKRDDILEDFRQKLKDHRIGYHDLWEERIEALLSGCDVQNFNSGDMGDFSEGYEISGDEVTEGRSGVLVELEEDLEAGTAGGPELAFENGRVLESFDEIQSSRHVAYGFDGDSLTDLKEKHPIQRDIGRGNFMYYFIFETDGHSFSVPINADLDMLVSYLPLEDLDGAHLARAPSFSSYMESFRDMLEDLDGVVHFSLNPPQVVSFQGKLSEIVSESQDRLDEFILTTDNGMRDARSFDYNFPGYLRYD